jgi:hypothetical protein
MIVSTLKRIWHDAMQDDRPLRLVDMLERGGGRMPDDATDIYPAAVAARRCVFCNTKPECDAWLASGAREGIQNFCPNADFVRSRSNLR